MTYEENQDGQGGSEVKITIDAFDFISVNLSYEDRQLLKECNKSNLIADKLLALEMFARKLCDKTTKSEA